MQEKTFYQLAGNNIDNTPVAELFKLTNEHPYFAAAQYFLSCKLNQEKHAGFLPQLQKTALFFNNPHWMHYQLMHQPEEIKILHKQYQEEETKPLLNHVIQEEIEQNQLEAVKHTEAINAFLEETKKQAPVINISPAGKTDEAAIEPSPIHIPTMEFVKGMMDNFPTSAEQVLPSEPEKETINEETASPSMTSFALEAAEENHYIESTAIEAALPVEPTNVAIEHGSLPEATQEAADINPEIINQAQQTVTEKPIEEEIKEPSPEPIHDVFPIAEETINHIEANLEELEEEMPIEQADRMPLTADKIANILNQQLEEFKKPIAADAVLDMETEPYHTVDYFASQGIKVGADNGSQDKLSKQLRKFTDWLKHMKHVEEPNDLGTDPELESAIQSIAKTSNEAREIVTETMAEVLEKQGKLDKAIQLYIKLSFLNPDKSTYFATKIQQLKGI